jgi:transcriptional regulator with XRE-family HTH domain
MVVEEMCSMGSGARQRSERLASKLREIRLALGLSQGGMVKRLGLAGHIGRERVSAFEKEGLEGREPPLPVLLKYAEVAGVWVDALIDDDLDLPKKLPATQRAGSQRGKLQKRAAKATVNTITVTLSLDIESDSNVSRDEDRARKAIEKAHLRQYGMAKVGDHDYELTISYEDEDDLNARIYALLGAIWREAKARKCDIKVDMREKGADRYW